MQKAKNFDSDHVHTFADWCELAGISAATGHRLLAASDGPKFVRLSARRIGVRHRDHCAWLDARTEPKATAA